MTALSAKNLVVGYNGKIIAGQINFDLEPGQCLGILGQNGAGKTTLLRCASGQIKPLSGQIFMDDKPINRFSLKEIARRQAQAGSGGQAPAFISLLQYVLLGRFPWLSWLGFYSTADRSMATQAMEICGIENLQGRHFNTLSAGQAQLAALARAFTQIWEKPALLILDEMSANLDLYRRMLVMELLAKKLSQGYAILQSIHDCNLAAMCCTHLLGIKNGAQLFFGPTRQVFTEENLSVLYDWPVGIFTHPNLHIPQIYPRAGAPFSSANAGALRPSLR